MDTKGFVSAPDKATIYRTGIMEGQVVIKEHNKAKITQYLESGEDLKFNFSDLGQLATFFASFDNLVNEEGQRYNFSGIFLKITDEQAVLIGNNIVGHNHSEVGKVIGIAGDKEVYALSACITIGVPV